MNAIIKTPVQFHEEHNVFLDADGKLFTGRPEISKYIAKCINENATLHAQLADAEAEAKKWRIALESLTAQGSEFHNDLDRCMAYVRERYEERHKALGDNVKLERKLADAVETMEYIKHNPKAMHQRELLTECLARIAKAGEGE